jgi:2,3-bisphosphoglycerate-independent phosphoglycerate mutase
MPEPRRHILIILDGYAFAEDPSVSAIEAADTPYLDRLLEEYPSSTLVAQGEAVGLPEGQMGNSEVGHLNIGAGRVVYQDITRIDLAIDDGSFFANDALQAAVTNVKENDSKLHLMGLFSDGGVHSSLDHLFALMRLGAQEGLRPEQVCVHAFMDGRDTDPHGGLEYVRQWQDARDEIGVGRLASIVGRYYAMDRDNRWPRTQMAYDLLTKGRGKPFDDPIGALRDSYADDVTDEFVKPRLIEHDTNTRVEDGDSVVFYNFRADRARQLTRAFTDDNFEGFDRARKLDLYFATFTSYDKVFDLPVAFSKLDLENTVGEVFADHGLMQLRAAETEKYAHVTYFFSGGREEPFEGEERILVPSPQVATYDLQPEMSAPELSERVAEALEEENYNFVVLNYANADMVGHTGDFDAAVRAVEAVDSGLEQVVTGAIDHGYSVQVISDHGNADKMKNPDGSPHTAHTTALVPHIIIADGFEGPVRKGKLGDVAPTMLALMDLSIPEEMTGDVLIPGHR